MLEAVPILAIENQLAMGDPAVTSTTLERLLQSGIDRMTAIEVLSDVMADSLAASVSESQVYDPEAYARALEQIDPAEIALEDATTQAAGDVPEFQAKHRQVLIEFGDRHAHNQAMSWPQTAGFLFAVQACPDLVMPSEWIEIVQGEAIFADLEEARAVSEARMALMNWISDCFHQDQPAIPVDCTPGPEPLRILETENNFSQWCRGVAAGHSWLEQSWDQVLKEDSEADRALSMALILFTFFDSQTMAERVVKEMARESSSNAPTLEELASKFHGLIEQAALEYAAIGLASRQAPSAPPAQSPVRSEKIGRNQPCPCGSGQKYKKCCGRPGAKHFQ
ncbi:MAG: UPF0149 family protein [Wenzhouxiangella sp.]|nr:UPF0149 family protein [Wenzhouxiangella sp.]